MFVALFYEFSIMLCSTKRAGGAVLSPLYGISGKFTVSRMCQRENDILRPIVLDIFCHSRHVLSPRKSAIGQASRSRIETGRPRNEGLIIGVRRTERCR